MCTRTENHLISKVGCANTSEILSDQMTLLPHPKAMTSWDCKNGLWQNLKRRETEDFIDIAFFASVLTTVLCILGLITDH